MQEISVEIDQKIAEYTQFVEKVLGPQYDAAEAARKESVKTVSEYRELAETLKDMLQKEGNNEIEQEVDLGYKTVFTKAVAINPTTIFVHVGMGFHVEFKIKEALSFCEKRIQFLETNHVARKQKTSNEILEHLRSAQMILDQLQQERLNTM
jgi:prefoldin subunit 5